MASQNILKVLCSYLFIYSDLLILHWRQNYETDWTNSTTTKIRKFMNIRNIVAMNAKKGEERCVRTSQHMAFPIHWLDSQTEKSITHLPLLRVNWTSPSIRKRARRTISSPLFHAFGTNSCQRFRAFFD